MDGEAKSNRKLRNRQLAPTNFLMPRIVTLLSSSALGLLLLGQAAFCGITIRLGYPGVGVDNRQFGYGNTAALVYVRKAVEEEF